MPNQATVTEIQVCGSPICNSLTEACKVFLKEQGPPKLHFTIRLPNGEVKHIVIRDEDDCTVAYGDFRGLPDFLQYSQHLRDTGKI